MWPFSGKVRLLDLLKKHFGEGPDGPVLIASGGEFVRSYPWVRFTCRGLDYAIGREHFDYGNSVEVGRADRSGRPADPSAFHHLSLEEMPAYNKDMFYWEHIAEALGDADDVRYLKFDELLATLSLLEPRLQTLFSGEAYVNLHAERERRMGNRDTTNG